MKLSSHNKEGPYELASVGDPSSKKVCIYLALSCEDSLLLDPFNQPVQYLVQEGFHVISCTIPGHKPPLKKERAMEYWEEELSQNNDILTPFFDFVASYIDTFDHPVSIMGLSRGCFCALHIASRTKNISHMVLFAPLLSFKHVSTPFDYDQIAKCEVYIAIGNNDRRVSTQKTVDFYTKLIEKGEKTHKSLPYYLRLNPSIGYMGHGSSKQTFKEGATWLARGIHLK